MLGPRLPPREAPVQSGHLARQVLVAGFKSAFADALFAGVAMQQLVKLSGVHPLRLTRRPPVVPSAGVMTRMLLTPVLAHERPEFSMQTLLVAPE